MANSSNYPCSATMRDRSLLPVKQIEEFGLWLELRGWKRMEPNNKNYEVLRMTHPDHKGVLQVYVRSRNLSGGEVFHATVFGISAVMAKLFIKERKREG